MRAEALDPLHVRRLRRMSPEERLRAALELNGLAQSLADAGAAHRERASQDEPDGPREAEA